MSKKIKIMMAMASFGLILMGCTVYSLNPFCTKAKEVSLPELNGNWRMNIALGDDVSSIDIDPWKISGGSITVFDRDNKKSDFSIVFFKINGKTFADVCGKSPANNSYWNLTVVPMHVLLLVEYDETTLTLTPASIEWFNNKNNVAVQSLKYGLYNGDDNSRIYTVSPIEWENFLSKNSDNPAMFAQKQKFVLQRVR